MYQLMIVLLSLVVYVFSPGDTTNELIATNYVIEPETPVTMIAPHDLESMDYQGPKVAEASMDIRKGSPTMIQTEAAIKTAEPVAVGHLVADPVTPITAVTYVDAADNLLKKYVNSAGGVDYDGLKDASAELDRVAEGLRKAYDPSMGRNEGLAYYINLYNVHTLKLIIDNYPVASIRDLHSGEPWTYKWIELDGTKYSLDHIEHTVIRPTYGDSRIHFAVNCAAATCPPLLNAAYRAETVDVQLEAQTRKFINNTNYNIITSDALRLSKIFKWYSGDFSEGVVPFINKYTSTEISTAASIDYLEYDWSLNKQ